MESHASVNNVAVMIIICVKKSLFLLRFSVPILDLVLHTTDQFPGTINDTHSSPNLSDFYTLSQTKLLENHTLHSGTFISKVRSNIRIRSVRLLTVARLQLAIVIPMLISYSHCITNLPIFLNKVE